MRHAVALDEVDEAAGVKDGMTTSVPPTSIVASIAAQLMFEYRPSEQSVTAPLW